MNVEELPLFELYTRLREKGLPLGLNEYAQLVKALQAGFGLPDQKALSRLCCALWVKNEEEEDIFNYQFAEVIGCKTPSHAEIAKTNDQGSTFYREAVIAQQLAAQTTRNGLIGISIALLLFLVSLAGLKFLPGIVEAGLQTEAPILTEPEREPNPDLTDLEGESQPKPVEPEGESNLAQPLPTVPAPPPQNMPQVSIVFLGSLICSMIVGTGVSWLFIRRLTVLRNDPSIDDAENITKLTTVSRTEITGTTDGEVQLAEMIRKAADQKPGTPGIKVLGQDEYFPLTRRQMKQGWRYLRRNNREGPKIEFDLEGTVNQIARQGMFLESVMRAPRSNRANLLLLIDQDGSMTPFQGLSKRLVNAAVRAGQLENAGIYYFHNCPTNYLYHDPLMQEPEILSRFLHGRLSSKSVIMIVSDAGAARGSFNPTRIRRTESFLTQLNQHVRYVVWLNPFPKNRWKSTSASAIGNFVPMFEIDRAGFQSAIEVLRGRWNPGIKTLR